MPIRDLKAQIGRLPEQPGVYLYFNAAGDTIYVGKARALRDRVRSYLGAYGVSPRTNALLDEADRLEVIVTDSVVEALALESTAWIVLSHSAEVFQEGDLREQGEPLETSDRVEYWTDDYHNLLRLLGRPEHRSHNQHR